MAERKRREMDPTIALLENCVDEANSGDASEQYTREQLEKMLENVAKEDRVELSIGKRKQLAIDIGPFEGNTGRTIGGDIHDVHAVIFQVRALLTKPF